MPQPEKSVFNTVVWIDEDKLNLLMDSVGTKPAMREAILKRHRENISCEWAALYAGVTKRGVSAAEDRLMALNKRFEELYGDKK